MPRRSIAERAQKLPIKANSKTTARRAAIEQMNEQLKAQLNRIEEMFNNTATSTIEFYYRLGTLAATVQVNSARYGGDNAFTLLEQAVGGRAEALRRAVSFALVYTKTEVKELQELANIETGYKLNWNHVLCLLTLKSADKRKHYAALAVREMLDPNALRKLIQTKQGGRAGVGGRPYAIPPTTAGQLRQIVDKTTDWVQRSKLAWNAPENGAFGHIMDTPPDRVTPELLQQAQQAKEALLNMIEAAKEDAARLSSIERVFIDILANKKTAAAG